MPTLPSQAAGSIRSSSSSRAASKRIGLHRSRCPESTVWPQVLNFCLFLRLQVSSFAENSDCLASSIDHVDGDRLLNSSSSDTRLSSESSDCQNSPPNTGTVLAPGSVRNPYYASSHSGPFRRDVRIQNSGNNRLCAANLLDILQESPIYNKPFHIKSETSQATRTKQAFIEFVARKSASQMNKAGCSISGCK